MLTISSDLEGVSFDMPYPLSKKPQSRKKLVLKSYFKGAGQSNLFINYGEKLSLAGQITKARSGTVIERGHVHFASGDAKLPKKKELYVTGNLKQFYPSRWARQTSAYSELKTGGMLNIPLRLNMNRLSVNFDEKSDDEDINIRPTDFPATSGIVKDLTFDDMSLGKLSVDIIHQKGSLKLNKLNIHSSDMDFNSSGKWSYTLGKHHSSLNVGLKTKDLGKLFKRLGFAAVINKGESDIKGSLNWAAPPFAF